MATPVGHGFAGLAVGMAFWIEPCATLRALLAQARKLTLPLFLAVVVANLADIDYLFGLPFGRPHMFHHKFTHSFCFSLAAGLLIWGCWRYRSSRAGYGAFLLIISLLLSHMLLDYLCADGSEPYGIMAAWPFTDRHYISPVTVFMRPAKSSLSEVFTWHNVLVGLADAAITAPLVVAVGAWKVYSGRRKSRSRESGIKDMRAVD